MLKDFLKNTTLIKIFFFQFTDCQCIAKSNLSALERLTMMPELPSTAKNGYCSLDCNNFFIYLILFSVFVFIHSTSEVGSMLLILRCVDTRDKAMALGLIQFAIGLFGKFKIHLEKTKYIEIK